MEFTNHIFNVKNIVGKVVENKDEPNLYEKVNQIMKGAQTGSPALVQEVRGIITAEAKKAADHLKKVTKALTKQAA